MALVFAGFVYVAATGVCALDAAAPQATCDSNSAIATASAFSAASACAIAVASVPIATAAVSPCSVMGAGAQGRRQVRSTEPEAIF